MNPLDQIAAYLALAEGLVNTLKELLEEIDPDGEDYPSIAAELSYFRHCRLELCGQTTLPLPAPAEEPA